jgi:CxxC motif-containing protein (DUF1111 family)
LRAADIEYFAVQMHFSPAHPAEESFCSRKIAAGNSENIEPTPSFGEKLQHFAVPKMAETGTSRFSDDKWCVKHPVSDMITRRGGP